MLRCQLKKKKRKKNLNKQKLSLIIICGKERKETQYLARIGHLMNLIRIHLEKFHLIRVQEERVRGTKRNRNA